eukprot:CAMPEP_0194762592 /NCGR_PEP_ID=MMETSP0323_2-20130528/16272_1 /TAXON_ID=2866 ORGANISM="Crypthecodinium cohnii, Strain Seligo" /NCGR_SAMPLE_ID=MMETSP0323_2 /ASSEMBLY_ACC=CAM_ASM_000346 /LENGTH=72 /DNA_ID=CAMNT_0039685309 /DNA_START=111 /DNA_END=326 /DNA_ORIENTATION=+
MKARSLSANRPTASRKGYASSPGLPNGTFALKSPSRAADIAVRQVAPTRDPAVRKWFAEKKASTIWAPQARW